MTCATCIGRRRIAHDFWPHRRPLYVRCYRCFMRRQARLHLAGRLALAVVAAVLVVVGACGFAAKVLWELRGLVGS